MKTPVIIAMHERDNVAIIGNDGGLAAGTVFTGCLQDGWRGSSKPRGGAALQSALTLPTSITFFQRANSLAWNSVNCSGELPTISKPRSSNRGLT